MPKSNNRLDLNKEPTVGRSTKINKRTGYYYFSPHMGGKKITYTILLSWLVTNNHICTTYNDFFQNFHF